MRLIITPLNALRNVCITLSGIMFLIKPLFQRGRGDTVPLYHPRPLSFNLPDSFLLAFPSNAVHSLRTYR